MATGSYDDPNYDPSQQQDWQNQIRQRILAQQDPSAPTSPTAAASTPSPDFNAAPTAPASPTFATSYGDGTTSPDQETAPEPPAAPPAAAPPHAPQNPGPQGVGDPGNDANQIQGWAQKFLGRNFSDADIAKYFTGHPLDVVMHDIANSDEAKAYAQKNQMGPYAPGPASAANPVQTAYGLSNGYATVPAASDPNQAWKDSIRQIISRRLAADQGPVDENSPQIQAALNASKDALTRQNTTERDALAERLYAQGGGLNTNAITGQIQQSNERTGTAQGTLRAQLLMSAYKDKFTELNHLLDLATQTGDTESARQIQVTLANLQAAVQREGLGLNKAEFEAQLNQNATIAAGN